MAIAAESFRLSPLEVHRFSGHARPEKTRQANACELGFKSGERVLYEVGMQNLRLQASQELRNTIAAVGVH
jgi:putative heme degradation protein